MTTTADDKHQLLDLSQQLVDYGDDASVVFEALVGSWMVCVIRVFDKHASLIGRFVQTMCFDLITCLVASLTSVHLYMCVVDTCER
jgi:hypothetical protein